MRGEQRHNPVGVAPLSPTYTQGSSFLATLGFEAESPWDSSEYKVSLVAGEIRFDFKKKGADGVAIYARLAGQTTWTKIGTDTSSPYIDGRPLATPGVPETREYMLRGLVKDDEIGIDSDVARIAWSGS